MITKKLMHDIQTWLNSFYDFDDRLNCRNNHIITNLENFAFRFISVNIRIWSLRENKSLLEVIQSYSANIRSEEEFKEFKDRVDSGIDKYIRVAIEESRY
jgi:exosome complex RNA-binding protein Rrp4